MIGLAFVNEVNVKRVKGASILEAVDSIDWNA